MFLKVVAFLSLAIPFSSSAGVFRWQDCGNPATRSATTDDLSFLPDPLRFGQNLTVGANFNVLRALPETSMVGLEVWRYMALAGVFPVDVKMPCIFGGDCRVPFYWLVRSWPLACDFLAKATNSTKCTNPITPNRYAAYGYNIYIPEPSALLSTVAAVSYSPLFLLISCSRKCSPYSLRASIKRAFVFGIRRIPPLTWPAWP